MSGIAGLALFLLTTALAYSGFACLACSQRRHWRAINGEPITAGSPNRSPRFLGAGLLAASLVAALWREADIGFGIALWVVMLSASAVGLVATLTWRPRWLRCLAFVVAPVGRKTAAAKGPARG